MLTEMADQVVMQPSMVDGFLRSFIRKGGGNQSAKTYRTILKKFYEFLPEGKEIDASTGKRWHAHLVEQGYSVRTVNARISAYNSFVRYLGRRQWQVEDFYVKEEYIPPELSRPEYLQLLQTAKQLGREREYFLLKVMGSVGLRLKDLPLLTVEALREGQIKFQRQKKVFHLPKALCEEMLGFAQRQGIDRGPLFSGKIYPSLESRDVLPTLKCISEAAQVSPERVTTRSLYNLCQRTHKELQYNISLLVEQSYDRIIEEEQLEVGWDIG